MQINGNTVEGLTSSGCRQIVAVVSLGTSATIKFFECTDNIWTENESMTVSGNVGQEDVITNMSENVSGTSEYNAGSAIFFHVGSVPTQGCISTDEENVLMYLAKLDKDLFPYILII